MGTRVILELEDILLHLHKPLNNYPNKSNQIKECFKTVLKTPNRSRVLPKPQIRLLNEIYISFYLVIFVTLLSCETVDTFVFNKHHV